MDNMLCKKYFAALNSADGFVNYFPQIFNHKTCSRIYVIKGGPGTGKSRFMRDVADEAERRGFEVIYYYCSSDSNSLDGIFIKELKIGILDGTAPHCFEPSLVGAVEQIVNLGDFWNARVLEENRGAIERLALQKSAGYDIAYSLLSAYGGIMNAQEKIVTPILNKKKLSGSVKRLLHRLPSSESYTKEVTLLRAVGMNGETRFTTFEKEADTVFYVTDKFHTAFFVLNEIIKEAEERRLSMKISYDPIAPWRADAVLLTDHNIAFVGGDSGERRINSLRFFDKDEYREEREVLKKLETEAQNILSLTSGVFEKIKEYHFAIEEIYSSAMDFTEKEKFVALFLKKLFK
ncbi:MAG: hypothetical protein IJW79_06815 [Clostridia bacterium]|nr:hypothetical protein [Clostridia bacterium]